MGYLPVETGVGMSYQYREYVQLLWIRIIDVSSYDDCIGTPTDGKDDKNDEESPGQLHRFSHLFVGIQILNMRIYLKVVNLMSQVETNLNILLSYGIMEQVCDFSFRMIFC